MKKDQKYFFKRCRLCGRCYDGAIDIFSPKEKNLQELIHQCLNIKVREDDVLPKKLCQFCDKKLMLWEKFKNSCENVQVKLIADSLPKKIEVMKNEKNGKTSGSIEANPMVGRAISCENLPKRKPKSKKEEGMDSNIIKSTSESLNEYNEITVDLLDQEVKQDFKTNGNGMGNYKSKSRGTDQLNSTIPNIRALQKEPPEASTFDNIIKDDSKAKVLEITDQEIKDIYDTISMNIKSEDKLNRMTATEINNNANIDSGHEQIRNNLLAKKLRKIQQKELKLKNKKKRPLKEYCCQICEEVFHSQRKMKSHLKSHSVQIPEAKRCESPKVEFQCPRCPQRLTTAFNLHQHLDTHSEICNYCCHVCGKLFKTNSSLLNHLRVHICDEMKESGRNSTILANGHSVKLYPCQVCDKKFRQSGHLAKHLKIHAGIRRFTCGECGMSFTEKYQLRRHVGGVHEKAKRYTCDVCGKQFLHTHNYKNHILQHEGVASVSCDVCGKAFVTSHAMNRHRRLHTGEKPFVCDICGKAFRDCSNRKRHRDKHIKEAEETLAAKKPSLEESSSHLSMIDAVGSNGKSEVKMVEIVKSESNQKPEISETVVFYDKEKDQEEGKAKKTYLDLKAYFESNDVVSLKDDEEDGDNVESPLDMIPLNGNHNVNILQQIHVNSKFDESSNPGPLFGGGLFGEELDLNPESLLLIGDGRMSNSLMEGTEESDGEAIKDQLVWVPSSSDIQSDAALSGIHSGDVALNGIQNGDLCLNGIQGDIGLNSIQTGDVSSILEVGMGLCGEFDVNSAMELDSGKDELPGDFPSISEIKAVEESDKSSDNVVCLQVCILV